MKHDEFVGRVQHLARLSSRGEAEHAVRVVLETLGERIQRGEANDLASQLPREIGRHLFQADFQESFDLDEFLRRVSDKLGMEPPDATYVARSVIEVLMEAASRGEIEDVLAQLPAEYYRLFVGAWGQMPPEDLSPRQYRQIWEEMQMDRDVWMRQEGWLKMPQAGGPQYGQQYGQRYGQQIQRGWQGQRQGGEQSWQRGRQQGLASFQPEREPQSQQAWQGEQRREFQPEPQRWQGQREELRWEETRGRQGQGQQWGQEPQMQRGQEGQQVEGYPQGRQFWRGQQMRGYPQSRQNW